MTRTKTSRKVRAVFLAFVMVVSMFGAPMAFAGSAAAAANGATVSDSPVQGGEEIQVNGSVDANGTVHAFIDVDGDGNYTGQTDISASVDVTNYKEDNSYSITLNAPTESGTYDVYVFQDEGETDSVIDEGDEGTQQDSLKVDADAPTFGNETPEDGSTVNQGDTDQIVIPISDANTSVTHITATVQNADGTINTWEIDPSTSGTDGVDFTADGKLVITPGQGNVPDLADGSYDVSITATDEVGNEGTLDFSFTVDSTNPTFSLNQPADGELTNDENQTVEVSVEPGNSDRSINDSTVTLTITDGNNEQTFTYTDDVYDNSTNTFTVDPSASEDIASFADGDVTVKVSAEDDVGNSNSDTFDFHVDTAGPEATGVVLSDADLNISDVEDSNAETVTVTFNESVDPSSVSANVIIDGETVETLSFSEVYDGDGNVVDDKAAASLSASTYGAIENDSAVVNVTAAQDDAGNSLTNPDHANSQTTFAIDTDGPSVELGELPNNGELSGYVNVSTFIASTEDVKTDGLTVEIFAGGNADAVLDVTADADNLDTQQLPDGQHALAVTVEDDSGNTDTAVATFTLDNGDDLTVQDDFLAGTHNYSDYKVGSDYQVPVDGQLNLSTDVFNYDGSGDVTYRIDGVEATEFDANDYNNDDVVTFSATDGSETVKVDVVVNRLKITHVHTVNADGSHASENPDQIGIKANTELSELNVTVSADDGYHEGAQVQLTLDDFNNTGDNVYVADVPELRDGKYHVSVDDVATDTQTLDTSKHTDFVVDNSEPTAIDSFIVDGNSDQLTIGVTFDQPVKDFDPSAVNVEGVDAEVVGVDFRGEYGVVYLTFNKEFQTVDAPNVTFAANTIQERYGSTNTDNSEVTKTEIHTATYEFGEGLNPMSVPAETGSVDLNSDAVSIEGDVEAIWAYEDGEWISYDPDAENNTLTSLEGGQGYIVSANESVRLEINAENVPAEKTQAIQSQRVTEGWNLIGHYQEGSQSVKQALAPLGDSTYSVQKGYTGQQVDQLEVTEAYWLFVDEEGYHVPVDYDGLNSEQPTIVSFDAVDKADSGETVADGDTVKLTLEATDTTGISTVVVDASALGGPNDLTLTETQIGSGVYTAEFTVDASSGYASDGDVVLPVSVIDAHGNSQSTSDSVTLDTVKPTINNLDPADGSSISVNDPTITVDVTDKTTGIDSSTISVDVDGTTTLDTSSNGVSYDADAGTVTIDISQTTISTLSDGDHTVTVSAADNAENSQSNSATFTVDTTKPSITGFSPSGTTVNDAQTTISVDVTDATTGVNESTISMTVTDSTSTSYTYDTSMSGVSYSAGTLTVDLSTTGDTLADGQVDVKVSAEDNVGNSQTNSASFTVDTTAPAYLGVSASGTDANGNTTLDVTLNDTISGLDKSTIDQADFNVTNESSGASGDTNLLYSIDKSSVGDGATGNQTVVLILDGDYSGDTLKVTIEGQIDDKVGNTLSGEAKQVKP